MEEVDSATELSFARETGRLATVELQVELPKVPTSRVRPEGRVAVRGIDKEVVLAARSLYRVLGDVRAH